MNKYGRPTVEDKRVHQYRVLMNSEENKMLEYCSMKTGLMKSQVFRKAVEAYYHQVKLIEAEKKYDGTISLKRVIDCPYCQMGNVIDFEDYITNEFEYQERQMGPEREHAFLCEDYQCSFCHKTFTVSGSISEYPLGAFDSEHIEIKGEK